MVIDFFFGMVGTSLIEWIAVACGLTNVALIIRRSIWNYPFGFLMVTLYFFIFWEYRLYSEAFLQVYFFVIQFYGLWGLASGPRTGRGVFWSRRCRARRSAFTSQRPPWLGH